VASLFAIILDPLNSSYQIFTIFELNTNFVIMNNE